MLECEGVRGALDWLDMRQRWPNGRVVEIESQDEVPRAAVAKLAAKAPFVERRNNKLVEMKGFEPSASALRTLRSPN